jgi:hypothetical protein
VPIPLALLYFGFSTSLEESLQVATSPLLPAGSSRRYLCESFLSCLGPLPRRSMECTCLFLPPCHRPCPEGVWVGFNPLYSANTTFHGPNFEAADISLCSGPRVCSPPRSFLPLRPNGAGQPRFLHPGLSCFVASARSGYASRPNTGNWRRRDFHPTRFAALSAAPPSCSILGKYLLKLSTHRLGSPKCAE